MLNKKYKFKRRPEKEMIFGTRAVIEAIEAGKEIDKILIRRDMSNALLRELQSILTNRTVAIQRVPVEKLNLITSKNHQGVVAFISPIVLQRIENIIPTLYEKAKTPFLLMLDGITDVRNLGAIVRTAECAGVDAIIIPSKGGASLNADAVKTSAGALLNIPICKEEDLAECIAFLQSSGLKICAATEKVEKKYTSIDMQLPICLIMGSEEDGISPHLLRMCDEKVSIPIIGKIKSLNVSVAAGILIYEIVRQRQQNE